MTKPILYIIFFLSFTGGVFSQGNRTSTYNTIGWYSCFGSIKLNDKWSIQTEYIWRRNNVITDNLQNILRFGISYKLHPKVSLRVGYAWVETFPYGEIPINSFGKDFTEHRLFEMVTVTDKLSIMDISHRFMIEQRFVGRYSNENLNQEDEFPLLNRLRYMLRCQIPLRGKEIKEKTPYASLYDEILIGFGENVNENIFDQNRLGILLGYRLNSVLSTELGCIYQILQLGREVNSKNVFQYNSGLILNVIITI